MIESLLWLAAGILFGKITLRVVELNRKVRKLEDEAQRGRLTKG